MSLRILNGDAIVMMRTLPDNSVHCCVTSPPYWGLRDYGVAGQIGLEGSTEEYLEVMRAVFREVYRVLRPDGTCWVNMGDCYFGSGKGFSVNPCKQDTNRGSVRGTATSGRSKDMVGMPWRLALALQADGWFLRCDIIWHKTNPMPESVYDRPTKAHEYVFLLAKSERYFFDAEAIKEPVSGTANARGNGVNPKVPAGWDTREGNHDELIGRYKKPGKNSRIYVERDPTHINKGEKRDADGLKPHGRFGREPGWRSRQNESFSAAVAGLVATRNNRSVWTISTAPFRGAHFATFPTALVRPCILAGTSERGCCAGCGVPWKRIIKKGKADREWQRVSGGNKDGEYHGTATKDYGPAKAQNASAVKARILAGMCERKTIGWAADCNCELFTEPIPCTVLDPFAGSGTTGQVALELGRRAILIELNADYIGLIKKRCGL